MFPLNVDCLFTRVDQGNASTLTLTIKDQVGGAVLATQTITVDRTETNVTAVLQQLHASTQASLAAAIGWQQLPGAMEFSRATLDILL